MGKNKKNKLVGTKDPKDKLVEVETPVMSEETAPVETEEKPKVKLFAGIDFAKLENAISFVYQISTFAPVNKQDHDNSLANSRTVLNFIKLAKAESVKAESEK
jgi:hypothetical protein